MKSGSGPNKVTLVLQKEWIELRQQRGLLVGMLLPGLIFAVLPLVILYFTGQPSAGKPTGLDSASTSQLVKMNPALAGMTDLELGQAIVGQQFSLLMMLLPAILPSIIASYSVVGEKTERTLEPVLATPIRTWEFLLGKCLTALLPAILITWVLAAILAAGVAALAVSQRVVVAIISPGWIVALALATPLLALISIAATVAVSSRVNDPRTAQQISAFMIIPVMAVFFGQVTGLLVLSATVALAGSLVLAVLALAAVLIMVRIFQREVILTRWS